MKRLTSIARYQPIARAVMVISAVAVLATGVTYAALQSQQATLTGNSIQTASADLRIGTSASTFGATRTGFNFNGIIPGAGAMPAAGNTFYLKNQGNALMALKVSVGTVPANTAGVNLDKVYVTITRVDTATVQKLPLSTLVASHATGGTDVTDTLAGATIAEYKVQASMDADAYSGSGAVVDGIDIVFSGTAVIQ